MELLVHCCCGPCATGSLPQVEAAGYQPFCWFYNPNIHPWQEHKARLASFVQLMEQRRTPYAVDGAYPLEQWLAAVASAPDERCAYCYRSRLDAAAAETARRGLSAFTTTLLISPYQDHALLKRCGEDAARAHGVAFVYLDLRGGFRSGQAAARAQGLYMQKYCGCIYSEKERYVPHNKE